MSDERRDDQAEPRFDEIFAKVRQRRRPGAPTTASDQKPRKLWPVVIAVAIIGVGGWFLARKLEEVSRIQDCVMAGRKNCAKIEDPSER